MSIIIIMLVFEPIWSHCPEICDHFRQPSQNSPALHDCTFIWFLLFSIITLSPVSSRTPPRYPPPSTGNCYNEQQNNRLNPCWFHALFREAQPNTIARQNDSLNLFNWKIFSFRCIRPSIIHYLQKLFAAFPYFFVIYRYRFSSSTL